MHSVQGGRTLVPGVFFASNKNGGDSRWFLAGGCWSYLEVLKSSWRPLDIKISLNPKTATTFFFHNHDSAENGSVSKENRRLEIHPFFTEPYGMDGRVPSRVDRRSSPLLRDTSSCRHTSELFKEMVTWSRLFLWKTNTGPLGLEFFLSFFLVFFCWRDLIRGKEHSFPLFVMYAMFHMFFLKHHRLAGKTFPCHVF